MKASELRNKSNEELNAEKLALGRELLNLRMQKGREGGVKPHAFKKARRTIARIETILQEKALAENE